MKRADTVKTQASEQNHVSGRCDVVITGIGAAVRLLTSVAAAVSGGFRRWLHWKLLHQIGSIAVLVLVPVTLFIVPLPSVNAFRRWSAEAGWWFPLAFSALYILVTQFPIPRTVFTLSCGVLFGPLVGIGVALVSTGCSALVSLTVIRYLGRDWVQSRLTYPAVHRVNAHLQRRGWLAVGSLRMIAAVPFSVLNYLCAVSSIRALPFTLATVVGSAPGTIATVLIGDAATGHANLRTVIISVVLFTIGLAGLILDLVKSKERATSHQKMTR